MKAKGFIGCAAVLLVLLIAGCGARGVRQADVSATASEENRSVGTTQADAPQSDASAEDPSADDPAVISKTPVGTENGTTAAGKAGQSATTDPKKTSGKAGETETGEKSGKTTSVPQLKPPATGTGGDSTRETGEAVGDSTRAQSGAPTTKPTTSGISGGTVTPGTTPKTGESTSTSTTKTNPTSPTKPDTTEKESETASTTKRVHEEAKGELVKATVTYLNDSARHYVSSLTEEKLEKFGVPDKEKKDILKHASEWTMYTIELQFVNNESVSIVLDRLIVDDNGKGDVYINGEPSAEIGLKSGGQTTEVFYVLAKKSDQDANVLYKIKQMHMRIRYGAQPESDLDTPKYVYSTVG